MAEPTAKYTVLRAICMAGERVEVGDTVDLTLVQYTELASAGKVGPLVEKKRKGGSKPPPAEKPAKDRVATGENLQEQGAEGSSTETTTEESAVTGEDQQTQGPEGETTEGAAA